MQIFGVDEDPRSAAVSLGDRHVVKMCLETAQILCTVMSVNGIQAPYRPTHVNHPCVRWAAESDRNWDWLHAHGLELAREYQFRYRRQHACQSVIESLSRPPQLQASRLRRPVFTVMSLKEQYRVLDPVSAHRASYRIEKSHLHQYRRGREAPIWL